MVVAEEQVKDSRDSKPDYKIDFPAFCGDKLKIRNKAGLLVPFLLNRAQMRLWLIIKADLEAGIPVRIIVLKPRQTGISTFFIALGVWVNTEFEHKRWLVISHEDDSAKNLLNIFRFFKNNIPEEDRPKARIDNRQEIYFDDLDNRTLIDTARNKNAGKSYTFNGEHMSEVGSWESQGIDADVTYTSLVQALPDLPGTFEILESTAEAGGDFFEGKWKKKSRFRKLFIPHYADPGYRVDCPEPFALGTKEEDPYGDEEEEESLIREGLPDWYPELRNSPVALEKEVWARLLWRRNTIEGKCNWDLPTFHRNYPTKPDHAFQATGDKVFDEARLNLQLERKPQSVIYRLEPAFDDLVAEYKKGNKAAFQSIGSKFRELITPSVSGKFSIAELPDPSFNYVIGADVGDGKPTSDFSTAVVNKIGRNHLYEVCSYEARIEPQEFAFVLYALGLFYNGALLGVEINFKGATTTIKLLSKELLYPNLYRMQSVGKTDVWQHLDSYGWDTNKKTKPMMRDAFRDHLRHGTITLATPRLINQLIRFKEYPDGKFGIKGDNDDLGIGQLIAGMMADAYYEKTEREEQRLDPNSWEGIRRQYERDQYEEMEQRFIL